MVMMMVQEGGYLDVMPKEYDEEPSLFGAFIAMICTVFVAVVMPVVTLIFVAVMGLITATTAITGFCIGVVQGLTGRGGNTSNF